MQTVKLKRLNEILIDIQYLPTIKNGVFSLQIEPQYLLDDLTCRASGNKARKFSFCFVIYRIMNFLKNPTAENHLELLLQLMLTELGELFLFSIPQKYFNKTIPTMNFLKNLTGGSGNPAGAGAAPGGGAGNHCRANGDKTGESSCYRTVRI